MDEQGVKLRQTILITGASGFTGQHACTFFSSIGMNVAALVHSKPENPQPGGISYYVCDLLDRAGVEDTVRSIKPDYVLHLGGKNSVPESWETPLLYVESNVMTTLYLLNALRQFPFCRILVAGSRLNSPLLPPYRQNHPYSLSKSLQSAGALSWASLFGQSVMVAEPSNLIGPGPSTGFCSLLGRHIACLEAGEERAAFTLSSRTERRDFLDVRDAVRAYAALLAKGQAGTIYRIDSGEERTLYDTASSMIKLASCLVPLVCSRQDDPDEEPSLQAPALYAAPGRLLAQDWRPEIPLEQSLADIMHYFRTKRGETA
ncbi:MULTISPECIES: NAD-dependent epimerase/dehydratase family protein [unclassified Paenibacillus]|uniref:NAD-dependent epimerase/dehydratase family protein n=1 Tax=unclassified Paenibacillus TaxID=185978 RepID=UPI00240532DF|nr:MULTISPECIES: NAD-dependent epimerase/dehydratase family protein [unclassified Paenibacillus]MDF9844983.1 GDP-4-dehydro-6-deoxy-D-mannose reductase [Paenibacillus sp. PastF-2]MDF9851582.1 GDP-4-dehydro-6-deoxy-D-mannose reductase [Paenibacillus sp. PastM-2]MDF9858166.1 GDP-4-dehydro-6-deoxy-D-mannose reductase [Paenibacillus sp. PastF-1]MDH6483392.1 GDP-4-dehydro-6-deoxy-D-mannose reductase [Paenibacillus sp. PastH-2]MDH6510842.1 GDP-4-dehydro-6-deoxy-D-mannose reductase [Paenibacillus sp. 